MSKSYDERIEAAQEWIEANGYMMNKENIGRLIAAFLDGDELWVRCAGMNRWVRVGGDR